MSPAFQKKMFEPFSQEHDNPLRPRGITGTGLGLAIVKHIITLMNGSLSVRSQQGKGTIMHCEIPFPNADQDPAWQQKKHSPLTRKQTLHLQGHVLLAEDNPINQEIALRLLHSFGLSVTPVEDGRQAVASFSQAAPDTYSCILMDIQMPLMNGYQATKAIRSLKRADARHIPIIAMTADAFAEAIEQGRQAGMNAHVTKPLNPELLLHTLHEFLPASE